jgi:hypothetical protein
MAESQDCGSPKYAGSLFGAETVRATHGDYTPALSSALGIHREDQEFTFLKASLLKRRFLSEISRLKRLYALKR